MKAEKIRSLLQQVRDGRTGVDEAMAILKKIPYEDIGFARIDTHRSIRTGMPEVIYCPGKTPQQVSEIAKVMRDSGSLVLATRASLEHYECMSEVFSDIKFHETERIISIGTFPEVNGSGEVLVLTAGTSDIPVAAEAGLTARALGCRVTSIYDIGVAGLHRLLDKLEIIQAADVIIAVAGMEGALPSVVAGLVSRPVIAVPTSTGYGANFSGLAPLLSMLNSCAPGVAVVNIDNGFGAGCLAAMINRGSR